MNAIRANSLWDLVRAQDIDIQFDLWEKLSKIFTKSKTEEATLPKESVLSDKEKLEIFRSLKGSWHLPEDEYSTDQLLSDIEATDWKEYDDRLMKLFEENEEVFIGH